MKKRKKAVRELTRKQKAFVHYLIENPKESATTAVMETYKPKTRKTAEVIASENLRKPSIENYLAKFDNTAQETVVEVMRNSTQLKDEPAHASIALNAAKDILDRIHGKATQKIEQHTTGVSVNIDLTHSLDAN